MFVHCELFTLWSTWSVVWIYSVLLAAAFSPYGTIKFTNRREKKLTCKKKDQTYCIMQCCIWREQEAYLTAQC